MVVSIGVSLAPPTARSAVARPIGEDHDFCDAIPQRNDTVNQQQSTPVMLRRSLRDFDRT
jgi:hypothetical protein